MPEIKFESDWLKANVNTREGDHIRFLDTGKQDQSGQWVFHVGVVRNGAVVAQKKFSLNKKNFDKIRLLYGSNSDKWEGKEMRVAIKTVENPKTGEDVEAIRLFAPGTVGDNEEPSFE